MKCEEIQITQQFFSFDLSFSPSLSFFLPLPLTSLSLSLILKILLELRIIPPYNTDTYT